MKTIFNRLSRDFSNFSPGDPNQASIIVELLLEIPKSNKPGLAFQISNASVYGWGPRRQIEYAEDEILLCHDLEIRTLLVGARNPDRLYELAYLAILSSLGESLEKKGFIRVHSLSGSYQGQGFLLHFNSGLGKSTMAYLMAQDPSFQLLGDEMTLLKNNRLHSFPLRLAFSEKSVQFLGLAWNESQVFRRKDFSPKLLLPIPENKILPSAPLTYFLYGMKSPTGAPWIQKSLPLSATVQFLYHLTIGKDLPQILELAFRRNTFFFLPVMLSKRLLRAFRLLVSGQFFVFFVGPNPEENLNTLTAFLNTQQRKSL